jgi:hypothetical protein
MILAGVLLVAAAVIVLLIANPFTGDRSTAVARSDAEASDEPEAEPASPEPEAAEPRPAPEEPEPEEPGPAAEPEPSAEEQPQAQPEAEPAREAAPAVVAAADQTVIPASTYTVGAGDTLYDIAGEVWSDPFLWPLLLQANPDELEDPDYLRPGQRITVPAWVTVESGLIAEQRRRLSEAHVIAYHHYRRLGARAIGLGMGQPQWWLERLGRARLNKAHWVLYSGLRYDDDLLSTFGDAIRDEDVRQVRGFVDTYGLPPYRR